MLSESLCQQMAPSPSLPIQPEPRGGSSPKNRIAFQPTSISFAELLPYDVSREATPAVPPPTRTKAVHHNANTQTLHSKVSVH
ncbi:unnamed protein product [Coccothraustes coccothraustes]